MRNVKFFFLTATAIGFFSLVGCSKSSNNSGSGSDSVFTSQWITLAMTFNTTDSDYEQTVSAPGITSAILDKGVILGYGAYLNQSNDTVVESAIEFDMYQTFSVGNILLQAGFDNSGLWYRYVVVPGSVMTTKGLTPAEVRSMSYAQVTSLLKPSAKKSDSPGLN